MHEGHYRWALKNRRGRPAAPLLGTPGERRLLREIAQHSRRCTAAQQAWTEAVYPPLRRDTQVTGFVDGVLTVSAVDRVALERVRRDVGKLLALLRPRLPELRRIDVSVAAAEGASKPDRTGGAD